MMKVHEPPKRGDVVGDPLAGGGFLLDQFVWISGGATSHQSLGGMELTAQRGQQIHSRHRLSAEQDCNVVAGDLQARGFLEGHGAGLVRRLLEHGSETEELAASRLVDDHFLLILVHGEDTHLAGDDHVGRGAGVAYFVDALAGSERFEVHLTCQHRGLFIVEQGKEGNIS